ncbi:spore germination protein, partial [Paenibacillus sp. AR247]|uniref:spore germination protein n=1 Tax=Paenibacillus sp. AR247 TaxID=1631599 RepID=UPI0015E3CD1C
MTSSEQTIYPSLDGNISYIRDKLCYTDDLKVRHLTYRGQSSALVYLESTVDPTLIERNVIRPLRQGGDEDLSQLFLTLRLETEHKLDKGTQSLLSGNCLFFVEDMVQFYVLTTPAKYERSITEPENEGIIRGPHNGFIEDLTVNLYQIRQQISSTDLKVHYHNIGSTAPRKVAVMYMNNLADPAVIKKVEDRLKGITLDSVISTGFIQEFMEDQPFSIFPQFLNTERPDHTGAYLLDGHVVIMLEGDPTALIVPVSFFCFYQTPDDYSNRWMIASFVRFIRLLSF